MAQPIQNERERDRKTASRFVFIRLIMRCCETVSLSLLKMGLKTVGSRWLHTFSMRICSLDLKTEKEHRIYVYRLWPVNMHLFNVTKNLFEHLEAVFPLPIHAFFVRSMAASLFFFSTNLAGDFSLFTLCNNCNSAREHSKNHQMKSEHTE